MKTRQSDEGRRRKVMPENFRRVFADAADNSRDFEESFCIGAGGALNVLVRYIWTDSDQLFCDVWDERRFN